MAQPATIRPAGTHLAPGSFWMSEIHFAERNPDMFFQPTRIATALLLTLSLIAPLALAAGDTPPLRLLANAVDQDTGEAALYEITVTDWTPEEQRHELIALLRSEGVRSIRSSLEKGDSMGRIGARGRLGIELRYAYRIDHEDGATIVLAAERPIDVEEAIDRDIVSRTYDTTVIVLELDHSDRGVGELMLGARASFDEDGELTFTNVVPNPVRLGNVRPLAGR